MTPESGYSIEDLARDAEGVISALELKRYILVGHSMGGKVAQLMASRQPEGLEGLVLIAPSLPSPMLLSSEERDRRHCCKVSDEAAFCLIQRPYISKTLLT
ncbi:alpha/beta hydrolase, partial [Escherichia coli]